MVHTGDERLVKEVKNGASQIEQAGAAAKQQGDIVGMLRPQLAESLEEIKHSFLQEAKRTGSARILPKVKQETRQSEIKAFNGFQMMSSAPGSGGPSKSGLVANLGFVLLTNGELALLEYERRRGEPSDHWIERLKGVVDHFGESYNTIDSMLQAVNRQDKDSSRNEKASPEEFMCLLNGVAKKNTETYTEIKQSPDMSTLVKQGINHGSWVMFLSGGIVAAAIIVDVVSRAVMKRRNQSKAVSRSIAHVMPLP